MPNEKLSCASVIEAFVAEFFTILNLCNMEYVDPEYRDRVYLPSQSEGVDTKEYLYR